MGTPREFWWSDHHLDHLNIIRYCARPFFNVPQMRAAIFATWRAHISDDDIVWILGDLTARKLPHEVLHEVADLPGRKRLVVGNHDDVFVKTVGGNLKEAAEARYAAAGLEVMHGNHQMTIGGHEVTVSHFPYISDDPDDDQRYLAHRAEDEGGWLLCGHVHEKWRQRGRQINVGIDAWGGRPVTTNELVELIEQAPCDRDVIPWVEPIVLPAA